ncbi:MAG: chitobiase/beta-hexosaminidase C-terminal domain-containing protein [Muribaculaceae bacterium]|nr:chitobiase/beta-hexosaminidase C-terminal domain-containing protein [Muribaculaceae bacterium]
MKKFLLSVAMTAAVAFGASAETLYTLTFGVKANQESCNQYNKSWTLTQDGDQWTLTGFSNNSNGWTDVRFGTKTKANVVDGSITSMFTIDGTVDQVVLNGRLQKTGNLDKWKNCYLQSSTDPSFTTLTNNVAVEKSSFSTTDADVTVNLTTPATNEYFRLYIENDGVSTNNGWFALKSMTFNGTLGGSDEPRVEAPKIDVTEGEWSYTVTLTCATEGAKIYYTDDDTTPSASSTLYTAPFELYSGNYTVKAIAILDDKESSVSSAKVEVPYVFDDFSPLAGMENDDVVNEYGNAVLFTLKGNLTYVYQNGSYLYVTDGNYTELLYGNNSTTYNPGDTFTELSGTYTIYNGLPEVTQYTLSAATAGSDIKTPMPVAADEAATYLTTSHLNSYIKFQVATISEVSAKNGEMTVGDTTVKLYNQFNVENFENMESATVEGIVSTRKTNSDPEPYVQFFPTMITKDSSSINEVAVDAAAADAVYYNLQGVRVENPSAGLYIRVAGDKATKVMVK